ncbi:hypothetical protein EBI00_10415 [Marinomonas hwangdonensis]|uniref:DUF2946 domain-containing protein n=1 Tax=Marinomonas hwangdonensis TaxID=1053647 RepID=A0A3M8Q3A6_9GAMM|nr:hypothetical protein [Marinomonas hwangdonensis]RNF50573.1 hypothetical protein EBI00_10415 [Marinomonas hwangdonensis]
MLKAPRFVMIVMCLLTGVWLVLSASIQASSYGVMSHQGATMSESFHSTHGTASVSSMSDKYSSLGAEGHADSKHYLDCVDHCALVALPSPVMLFATAIIAWPPLSLTQQWRNNVSEPVTPPPRLSH